MKKTLSFVIGLHLCLVVNAQNSSDKLAIRRIRYFYYLKDKLADKSWPGFGQQRYDVDLAYYSSGQTYVVDADGLIGKRTKLTVVYNDGKLKIGKTPRLDTISFHMSTAYEDKDSSILWYRNPMMLCSDYESTRKHVPDVPDIRTWATMVMHEYFHGFQFRHPAFIHFANDSVSVSNSRLQSYYDNYPWFRESVEKENKLLLECLDEKDASQIKRLLKQYLMLRGRRLAQFKKIEKFDLGSQEDFLEKTEGSSRYMEYQLYLLFKKLPPDKELQRADTAYKPALFRDFKLTDKPWMYESNSIRYFYSVGLNIFRLLDKLRVSYKQKLFDDNSLTLSKLLAGKAK
ncbi:MAG: hypothetical protein JST32_00705 [Bacteroidetes bacterium]|nr:hypothetical protein [Bacteroidota bacterium]